MAAGGGVGFASHHSLFRSSFFSFLFCRCLSPRLLGLLSPNFATWSSVTHIHKIRSEIWVPLSPEMWRSKKNIKFRAISPCLRLDREYLRNATRYRQSENGVANYGHFRTGKLNLVYLGPQTAKNRTGILTHPPAIVQRIGVNKSVAFDRWRHWPTQRAIITLGLAMLSNWLGYGPPFQMAAIPRGPSFWKPSFMVVAGNSSWYCHNQTTDPNPNPNPNRIPNRKLSQLEMAEFGGPSEWRADTIGSNLHNRFNNLTSWMHNAIVLQPVAATIIAITISHVRSRQGHVKVKFSIFHLPAAFGHASYSRLHNGSYLSRIAWNPCLRQSGVGLPYSNNLLISSRPTP